MVGGIIGLFVECIVGKTCCRCLMWMKDGVGDDDVIRAVVAEDIVGNGGKVWSGIRFRI